jgi:hypothetical protein
MNFSHCAEKIHPQDGAEIMNHANILKNFFQPIALQNNIQDSHVKSFIIKEQIK